MEQLENEEDVAIHQQIESFLRQLIWREFSYYQLVHQPFFTTQPLRSDFLQFQWEQDTVALEAWKAGKTSYPLVDFNAANNAIGWQWVAGTGIDATPYFQIFNPTRQSEKFDTNGDYVKNGYPS